MSNIIKSTRIRSTAQIDLGKSQSSIEQIEDKEVKEGAALSPSELEIIADEHRKKQEEFDLEIQKMQKAVDIKIEGQLQEATLKCAEMEKVAQQKYEAILIDANSQKEQILKQAILEAESITAKAQDERKTLINNVENEIVQTMITLIDHIIGESIVDNVDWIKVLVRKMLKVNHTTGEHLKLFVSEHNMQYIQENEDTFRKGLPNHLEIERDDMLNDTQCHLMTSEGTIEYDVSEGLKQVLNDLKVLSKLS